MAKSQFFHMECYARVGSKQTRKGQTKTKLSAEEIAAEVARLEGHCDHVEHPEPPVKLYGCDPFEFVQRAEKWAEKQTDAKGRKYRKDGLCLLAGVVSISRDDEVIWDSYKADTIEYFKRKYGDRLLCVMEHRKDEAHPHLHFYVVPRDDEDFEAVHEGKAAAAAVKANGGKKGDQNQAYRDAMRSVQDDFYNEVSAKYGLSRIGPERRRLTRAEWKAEQIENAARAAQLERLEREQAALRAQSQENSEAFRQKSLELQQISVENKAAAAAALAAHDAAAETMRDAEKFNAKKFDFELGDLEPLLKKRSSFIDAIISDEAKGVFTKKLTVESVKAIIEKIDAQTFVMLEKHYKPWKNALESNLKNLKLVDFFKEKIAELRHTIFELTKKVESLEADAVFTPAEIEQRKAEIEEAAKPKPVKPNFGAALNAAQEVTALKTAPGLKPIQVKKQEQDQTTGQSFDEPSI